MEEKKVTVLLSAYNGEKYIGEQIDSILNQTYQNIEIYVRDDGSKDKTVEVLKEYETQGKIHLEQGKNVGFIDSFFWLINHSGDSDYYAFADQDDVWCSKKVQFAVERLEREKMDEPILYFTNYDFYDGNLNFVEHRKADTMPPSFRNAVVDCMPLGFNTVFNKAACETMRNHTPKHSCGHDWWTYMVCAGLGRVIYDSRVTVKYRRHEKNVSAGGMDFIKFQVWRFRKFFKNDYFKNVRLQLREYENFYQEQLSPEDRKVLGLFTQEKYHIGIALKKVFYPKRFRRTVVDEIMVRIIFLIGKL